MRRSNHQQFLSPINRHKEYKSKVIYKGFALSIHQEQPFQIRLLLPRKMVSELDSIASSRQVSRLALIRRFLQLQIEDEFRQLETYFKDVDRRKKVHERLQEHLEDNEW